MTRPAVFFDRDNTLIACNDYLGDPARVVLVDGAAALVAKVRALGFATVIFSNQSGVARGMFGEEAVHAVNSRLDEMLLDADPLAVIDRHEFCPYHPQGTVDAYRKESDLRKPRAGMIHQAAAALGLDLARSWVVGDAPRDIEAGKVAGCRTILVRDPSLNPSPAAAAAAVVTPDFTVASLREAGEVIAREVEKRDPAPATPATPAAAVVSESERQSLAAPADEPKAAAPAPVEAARLPASSPRSKIEPPKPEHQTARLEELLEEVLDELRRREDVRSDFSVTKLIAGIVQVVALAALFIAYLRRDTPALESTLLTALVFQTFTIALLIMERQR
jgi:D-glycero-D-manno-heptose 1,7-bisphosphate phosphatase